MGKQRRADSLTAAVRATDLPALIAEHFPESKCQPGRAGVFFASWRGNHDTPALSISRRDHTWLWHDMASDEGGNAFDFLVKVMGYAPQVAAVTLLERAGMPVDAPPEGARPTDLRPLPPEAVADLQARSSGVAIPALAGRGFNRNMVQRYGIRADGDDALIPITSPEGVVMQVKRRVYGATKAGEKYRYEHKGYGGPAWCSDNSRTAPILFLVEGELNAIVAHAALQEAGETNVGVMGMAGASSDPFPGLCLGKTVYIYADDDAPGEEARQKWAEVAREEGARSVHICLPSDQDFCDYAGRYSRGNLILLIEAIRASATQLYGALDRLLVNGSVRDYLGWAENYVNGGIIHPTGFQYLDRETGGIRESGVFGVAGLPSMGKSAVLRRILIEQVRMGGIVRLYSPDQSPRTVYRLLATLLSGVGLREVRSGNFQASSLRLYGSPEAARKAWLAVHEHVILELSQRFQATEEGEADAIFADMERAVDQGVTMFGIDYLQAIEPSDHRDKDGQVAKDLRKLSHKLRAPVVAAMQLAKYKFPASRLSGLPIASDIEGSGSYFQDTEMMLMVYNDEIYIKKYGGPNTESTGDTPGEAQLILTKDKEGAGDDTYYMRWEPRLVTYHDNMFPWDLGAERKGLM